MSRSKRDQLLDVAVEMFFTKGCHTTGIDHLLDQAGVAKMTLYSHFKSKEDLILAAAERVSEEQLERLEAVRRDGNLSYEQQLHAVFDDLEEFIDSIDYAGCPFQNVAVEFKDPEHPVRQLVVRHKKEVERRVVEALRGAGAKHPEAVARRITLLAEGAKIMVQITGDRAYLKEARAAGRDLLLESLGQASAI